MNFAGALLLTAIFILVYIIVIEIFTVLFRLTGLSEEKARFQVTSLLTNSGYTTQESEQVLNSSRRRNLALVTMVFGYVNTVIIISFVVNVFLSLGSAELSHIVKLLIIFGGAVAALILLMRSRAVRHWFDRVIERLAHGFNAKDGKNQIIPIDMFGRIMMARVEISVLPQEIVGMTLRECGMKERLGVNILFVKHGDEELKEPHADTVLSGGDTLMVLGSPKAIKDLFWK